MDCISLCLDGLRKIKLCILKNDFYIPDTFWYYNAFAYYASVGEDCNLWTDSSGYFSMSLASKADESSWSVGASLSYIPDGFWFVNIISGYMLVGGGVEYILACGHFCFSLYDSIDRRYWHVAILGYTRSIFVFHRLNCVYRIWWRCTQCFSASWYACMVNYSARPTYLEFCYL